MPCAVCAAIVDVLCVQIDTHLEDSRLHQNEAAEVSRSIWRLILNANRFGKKQSLSLSRSHDIEYSRFEV